VLDAISMLHDVRMGESPRLGRRVVIYGGGNTAMGAARTARRLGADEALIIYRRDRAHMPAHAFEADEALSEGVKIEWPTRIKEVVGPDLTVEMMELDAGAALIQPVGLRPSARTPSCSRWVKRQTPPFSGACQGSSSRLTAP
jgi:NADPH-dependent glutamate synthase beta subunit-like oxidoreductase